MTKQHKIIFLIFLLFVPVLIVWINKRKADYRNDIVHGDYKLTMGQINDLRTTEGSGRIVEYTYVVAGKKYDRIVKSDQTYSKYKGLDNSNRYFFIIYLADNPAASLVNLHAEHKCNDSLNVPKALNEISEFGGNLPDSILLLMFQ
jgi:hypothetical protein